MTNKLAVIRRSTMDNVNEIRGRIITHIQKLISECPMQRIGDVLEFNSKLDSAVKSRSIVRLQALEREVLRYRC